MSTTLFRATYDGSVLHPHEPLQLPANCEVWVSIEQVNPDSVGTLSQTRGEPYSSLEAIASLNLQGPPDWSKRLDKYRYGGETESGG